MVWFELSKGKIYTCTQKKKEEEIYYCTSCGFLCVMEVGSS